MNFKAIAPATPKNKIVPLFLFACIILCLSAICQAEESRTVLSAHQKTEIGAGINLVYCPTFQMAWDSFNNEIIKGKVKLDKAQQLTEILNSSPFGTDNLTPDSYYAKSAVIEPGRILKPDLLKEFIAKFGEDGNSDVIGAVRKMLEETPASQLPGFLAFAYLEKFLAYSVSFEVFDVPLRFSDNNSEVLSDSFGISNASSGSAECGNIDVMDYIDPDNFIIVLKADSVTRSNWNEIKNEPDIKKPEAPEEIEINEFEGNNKYSDEIILAKVPPMKTLEESWEAVKARMKNKRSGSLKNGEKVQIPKIKMDLTAKYSVLHGARLLNPGFEGYFIADTLQAVKFELNEKGAELRSYAIVKFFGGSMISYLSPPRSFIFNRPFLMALRQKGREPYLICWIANSELLKKWTPDASFVDQYKLGADSARKDIASGKKVYMVHRLGNTGRPEICDDIRQIVMKRDFDLEAAAPDDSLQGSFRQEYISGYNNLVFGAIEKEKSIKLRDELEKLTQKECEISRIMNSPAGILFPLLEEQNQDGSWGDSDTVKCILTPLGTLAFLSHGEKPESKYFGEALKRSISYLSEKLREDAKFSSDESAMLALASSEASLILKDQNLLETAKLAGDRFLMSEQKTLNIWNVLAVLSLSGNDAVCGKDKTAKFAETLKDLPGSGIAREILDIKLFGKLPDEEAIERFIGETGIGWDDLGQNEIEDRFALMILALEIKPKTKTMEIWKNANKEYVTEIMKRQSINDDGKFMFVPAKWKTDEMYGAKFSEKDLLLLSLDYGALIKFVYYRYLCVFWPRVR